MLFQIVPFFKLSSHFDARTKTIIQTHTMQVYVLEEHKIKYLL